MAAISSNSKMESNGQAARLRAAVLGKKASSNKYARTSRDGKVMDVGISVSLGFDEANLRRRIIVALPASVASRDCTLRNPISFVTS